LKLLISMAAALLLKHGVYVRGSEPCKDPPNASILFWDGVGFSGAHSGQCTSGIKELGGTRFEVTNTCRAAGDGSPNSPGPGPVDTFVLDRQSRTKFLMFKGNDGAVPYHWCSVKGATTMSSAATEQNREIIRKAFEAWQHGTSAITDVFADNMVWRIEGRSAESKEYPDKKAFIDQVLAPFAARFKGSSTPFRPARIRSIFADGATVIVVWDGHGIARDGIAYDNSYTWIMAMKDGLVVDGTAFYDSIAFNEFWDRVKP
jgi:ketosteroid isomerase-like protein